MKNFLFISIIALVLSQGAFAKLPQAGADPKSTSIGVATAPLDEATRTNLKCKITNGVVVTNVDPKSIASDLGVKKDDVIHSVNGQDIVNADQLTAIINRMKDGDRLNVNITRNGKNWDLRGILRRHA